MKETKIRFLKYFPFFYFRKEKKEKSLIPFFLYESNVQFHHIFRTIIATKIEDLRNLQTYSRSVVEFSTTELRYLFHLVRRRA